MPEISRFFGIIIRIFTETGTKHHTPHIHVYYQEHKAVYSIIPIECLVGQLPRRQHRFVVRWMQFHQQELLINWKLAIDGEPVNKITPLES